MTRLIKVVLATTCVLLVIAPGALARPVGQVPSADALNRVGTAVSWPTTRGAMTVAPGQRVRVRVARRRGRAAEVSLGRVSASGVWRVTVRRVRLLRSAVAFTVPAGAAHLGLRLRLGRLSYTTWLDVPAPAPAPTSPTAPVPPVPSVAPVCLTEGVLSAELRIDQPKVVTGQILSAHLVNTGGQCVDTGYGYQWSRQVDGQWVDVHDNSGGPAVGLVVWAGRQLDESVFARVRPDDQPLVLVDLPPGHYRLSKAYRDHNYRGLERTASVELDVTGPPVG
jgi:hypothetical protein